MFLIESQRKKHLQASLIPKKIWDLFFKRQLTSSEIQLMTSMPKFIRFNALKWRRNTVYLCFLYAYPKIKPVDFLKRIDSTHDSIHHALKAVCIANRIDILNYIAAYYPDEFRHHLEWNHFSVIHEAVYCCSFKVICSLFSLYTGDVGPILQAGGYQVLILCSWRRDFETKLFDFLLALTPHAFNEIPAKNRFWIFKSAVLKGNESLVCRILALWPEGAELLLRKSNFEAYVNAVISGNLVLLRYLFSLNYHPKEEVIRHNQYGMIHSAVKKGRLKILNELCQCLSVSELEALIRADEYELLYLAAHYGRIQIFNKFFKLISSKENPNIEVRLSKAFIGAAQLGHVSMMSRLMFCFPNYCDAMNATEHYAAFRKAALHGHLSVLQFLSHQFPQKIHEMIRSDNFYAFREATFFGYWSVVEYLIRSYPQATSWMIAANDFDALVHACYSQDVSLVKWLASKVPGRANRWIFAQDGMAFLYAISGANFPLIKYLITLLGADVKDFLMAINPDKLVSNIQDVRVLKYIVSIYPEFKDQLILAPEYNLFDHAIR